jgi:hypothetical protein
LLFQQTWTFKKNKILNRNLIPATCEKGGTYFKKESLHHGVAKEEASEKTLASLLMRQHPLRSNAAENLESLSTLSSFQRLN